MPASRERASSSPMQRGSSARLPLVQTRGRPKPLARRIVERRGRQHYPEPTKARRHAQGHAGVAALALVEQHDRRGRRSEERSFSIRNDAQAPCVF